MATYRENKGSWEIRWSYLGKTYSKGLPIPKTMKAKAEKLAREKAEELDLFLSKLETGLVTIPSDCQDLKLWFFSCGSAGSKTTKVPNDYKLFQMFADFKESLTYQDYKPKTKQVTDIHIRHFTRLMSNKPVAGIGTAEIQSYITKRAKEKTPQGKAVSGDTIRKELGTLSAIWNVAHIAEQVSQTYQKAIKPKGLKLPNVDAKLDWQTIEQVEAQVPLCKNKNELADLWASLFLRIEEEEQLLEDVKNRHG
nr:phage integrase N-terminal SAM-like domain-containing protein [Gemmatales bacterium]